LEVNRCDEGRYLEESSESETTKVDRVHIHKVSYDVGLEYGLVMPVEALSQNVVVEQIREHSMDEQVRIGYNGSRSQWNSIG